MIDMETIQNLRTNFSARKCVMALFECAAQMAKAIGVTVKWEIESIDPESVVDRQKIQAEFGKLTAIIGAFAAGARFNPVQFAKDQRDAAKFHRQKAAHSPPRQEDD